MLLLVAPYCHTIYRRHTISSIARIITGILGEEVATESDSRISRLLRLRSFFRRPIMLYKRRLCGCGGGGGSRTRGTALLQQQLGRVLFLLLLSNVLTSHLNGIQSVHGQSATTTFDRWTSCATTVTEIINRELRYSSTDVPRLHIICPGTFWEISYLDHYRQDLLVLSNSDSNQGDIQPMIPLRSNMILRCGDDGRSENSCIVSDGYIQLDGTSLFASQFSNTGTGTNTTSSSTTSSSSSSSSSSQMLNNIVIEGLTFVGGRHAKQSLLAQSPGSITFRRCIWRDFTKALAPIMLDYYDPYPDSNPTTVAETEELVVTFQDCVFEDNRYFGTESHPALIVGNGEQNRIVVETTVFQNNDMIYNNTLNTTHSFLIQSLGPVCLDRTCFIDNYVGAANVAMFGNTLTSSQIFVSNAVGGDLDIEFFDGIEEEDEDDDLLDGSNMTNATDMDELPTSVYGNIQQGLCDFAASFQTLDQYERMRPICIQSTALSCFASQSTTSADSACVTPEPTSAPTALQPATATTTSPSPTAPIPGAEFNADGGN